VTAFAGIVRYDGSANDADTEDRVVRSVSLRGGETVRSYRTDGALFVSRETEPIIGKSRSLFVALARLDNRDELGTLLHIASSELAGVSDSMLLMRIIERQGAAGLARCLGRFAFAWWHQENRRLILGRDYLGINHALFFHRARDFSVFATSLPALLSLPFVPREIDEIALANFMALNLRATDRTLYSGVDRVASRTLVTLDPVGTHRQHYWSPAFDSACRPLHEEEYVEQARELFDRSVAAAIAGRRQIAISTSGGLDSSAIAATAARLGQAERITCYTLIPPAGGASQADGAWYPDESDKVVALRRMHPELELRLLAPDAPHPSERDPVHYFAATSVPALDPTNLGWFSYLYDAVAGDSCRVLLDGAFGNVGMTWDGKFALAALFRSGDWRTAARELRLMAAEEGVGLTRILASHAVWPNLPTVAFRLAHRLRGRDPQSVARYSGLNPTFIAERDLVRQWQKVGFDPWFRKTGWASARHRAFQLFDNNQPARDFLASLHERYGFEVCAPHADRRLLEFVLTIPEPLYHRRGVPRSFARAVFADRLPREILQERRRGAQGGDWFRRLDARRRSIADDVERLEESPLARRLLDLPRLRQLVGAWPSDEHVALARSSDYKTVLSRAVHIGCFIRWVESGNA
jgi:asparagine synthase (glutamine-hydrolysing)